ncbi:MAG: GNAT family protein [Thermoflexales bacterium]
MGDFVETPRLRLRRLESADLEAMFAYRNDPEVARYQTFSARTRDEIARMICSQQDLQPGAPGTDYQVAVGLKPDDVLIGDVYFGVESTGRQAEIGYTLAAEFQGYGYATEAVRGVLVYAFERIGLHRVAAGADPRNLSSLRLLERLGFRREGYSPESYWDGETWTDDVRYAMLAREWRSHPR